MNYEECKCCIGKTTTYMCLTCKVYRENKAIYNLQQAINNIKDNVYILINYKNKYIVNSIDFKNVKYKITHDMSDDIIACIVSEKMLNPFKMEVN